MPCKEIHQSECVLVDRLASIVLGCRAENRDCSPLEFLALLAPAFPNASLLSFESRFQPLRPWGQNVAKASAAAGFSLDASASATCPHLHVKCVSCGASVQLSAHPSAFPHRLGCQFERVRALCSTRSSSPVSKRSLRTRRLLTHLRTQLTTTKARVAREFGFTEDKMCIALAKQFLDTGRPFADAGALVDSLTDICLAADPLNDVFDGVSRLIVQTTPSSGPREKTLKAELEEKKVKEKDDSDLRRETRTLLSRTLCRVCRTWPVKLVLLPCSHLALCETCAPRTKRCPACNEEIVHVIKTVMA